MEIDFSNPLVMVCLLAVMAGSALLAFWVVEKMWQLAFPKREEVLIEVEPQALAEHSETTRAKWIRLSLAGLSAGVAIYCAGSGLAAIVQSFAGQFSGFCRILTAVAVAALTAVCAAPFAYLAQLLYRRRYWQLATAAAALTVFAILALTNRLYSLYLQHNDASAAASEGRYLVLLRVLPLLGLCLIYSATWPLFRALRRRFQRIMGLPPPSLKPWQISETGHTKAESAGILLLFLFVPIPKIAISSSLHASWSRWAPRKARLVNRLGWATLLAQVAVLAAAYLFGSYMHHLFWLGSERTPAHVDLTAAPRNGSFPVRFVPKASL